MATDINVQSDDRIGGFRFVRVLHQGQNSTVMEVVQESTGKRFVLKQLLPSRIDDSAERKAFEFEAKMGMLLRHPNLIRIHEYHKDREGPYFVMDYFPSSTHLRMVVGKPREYEWVRPKLHWIIEQAASALAYMHDQGWVHRDIKPENIIINKVGETRVIDYALMRKIPTGLAKLFSGKPPRQGTHSYMSPEQIRCEPPAVSADVYSFGVLCYELGCGRQPFRANSPSELLSKHIKELPSPPTVHNKNLTPEYSDLVMQMLRKKPADRPKDLHEFLSKFSRIRIYKDDPDPQAGRNLY
ncbi:MAG: serine/threonine protein kinase [Isosphaeraceae bacterium]|nr:serine/threonine protein kinase [Isosphaeraceae bacterium]